MASFDEGTQVRQQTVKMRQSLESSFSDSLHNYNTPTAAREISNTIDNESAKLQGRIRTISDSSDEPIGDESDRTGEYIDQRQELIEDIEAHHKNIREEIRKEIDKISSEGRTEPSSGPTKSDLRRALAELDKTDGALQKERTALAADRIRVKYGVLGQARNVKIGEAYMMAITDNLPEPAESSYKKKHGRSRTDQTSFRNRLIKAYNTKGSEILDTPPEFQTNKIWCPISGNEFETSIVKAAHIVPHSIGETNAAYLFGCNVADGYGVMWSEKNGLMMHTIFEALFDDGRIIIVPDPTDNNEFITIVLSPDILKGNKSCPPINAPWSTIHRRRLQFQTTTRPGKRYLYMHALLTLFRRRRYNVPRWENDREQVFSGQVWASPGKWARRSMVEALALEVGDSWEGMEAVGGLGEFPDAKSPSEEKRVATVVRYTLETRASDAMEEDEMS